MKKWTRWQDWTEVVVGLYAGLSTTWTHQGGASAVFLIGLGALLILGGLWNLFRPASPGMEYMAFIRGAILFLAPWVGSYTIHTGAAWTSWICGAVAVVAGLWALRPAMASEREHQAQPA